MLFIWDAVNSPMVAAVLGTAPCKSLIIKLRDVAEDPAGDKVVLHEADEPFNGTLCKRMTWLAQLRLEAGGVHESLIIVLPDRMSFLITAYHDTLHVVCQHILWYPHEIEGMDHSDEQVLLFRVREELHIPFAAVVADHG